MARTGSGPWGWDVGLTGVRRVSGLSTALPALSGCGKAAPPAEPPRA